MPPVEADTPSAPRNDKPVHPLAAAQNTDPVAALITALKYAKGEGVPKDYALAFQWCQIAADQGLPEAQCNLGLMFLNGQGIAPNTNQAAEWFQKAALSGNDQGQFYLGICYLKGTGRTLDYAQAVDWFQKAAQQNNPMAQQQLALIYFFGQGVAADYAEAYKWILLARRNGFGSANAIHDKIVKCLTLAQMLEGQWRCEEYDSQKQHASGAKQPASP